MVSLLLVCGLVGCAVGKAGRGGAQPSSAQAATCRCECPCAKAPTTPARPVAAPQQDSTPVPVTAQDPSWGNPDAPVTVVEFSDFQCPFCAHVLGTLQELKRAYGPEQLRLVWKNFPLPFHVNARAAAEAAMTAFATGGNQAFWKYHDLLFAQQEHMNPDNFAVWAGEAGLVPAAFDDAFSGGRGGRKVDDDLALARRLRIRGTPSFLINGVVLAGAQPIERFKEIIDAQLAAAKGLIAAGLPAHEVYPALCARNIAAEPARPERPPESEDTTIWSVPVEPEDPVRGSADALVTIVVFSDFQCPFCGRLESTLDRLRERYGRELRIVWKDRPLPFHEHAVPAAVLARVAMAEKGPDGFWQAHDAILARQPELGRRAFKKIATQIGIRFKDVEKALADRRYQPFFDASAELSDRLNARGTPTSFVNGYRIVGAVPFGKFVAVVDAQLARAQAMVAAGQPRAALYQAIAKAGKRFEPPELKPSHPAAADGRGASDAK
jgi:protein-disulfide isomerase